MKNSKAGVSSAVSNLKPGKFTSLLPKGVGGALGGTLFVVGGAVAGAGEYSRMKSQGASTGQAASSAIGVGGLTVAGSVIGAAFGATLIPVLGPFGPILGGVIGGIIADKIAGGTARMAASLGEWSAGLDDKEKARIASVDAAHAKRKEIEKGAKDQAQSVRDDTFKKLVAAGMDTEKAMSESKRLVDPKGDGQWGVLKKHWRH